MRRLPSHTRCADALAQPQARLKAEKAAKSIAKAAAASAEAPKASAPKKKVR